MYGLREIIEVIMNWIDIEKKLPKADKIVLLVTLRGKLFIAYTQKATEVIFFTPDGMSVRKSIGFKVFDGLDIISGEPKFPADSNILTYAIYDNDVLYWQYISFPFAKEEKKVKIKNKKFSLIELD